MVQQGCHLRVDADQEGFAGFVFSGEFAHLAQPLQSNGLGREHYTLALAGRTLDREDLAHAVSDVLAGHLDQPER